MRTCILTRWQTIKCLLIVPNPESALNEEAGRLLLERYEDYASHARLITSIHAKPSLDDAASTTTDDAATSTSTDATATGDSSDAKASSSSSSAAAAAKKKAVAAKKRSLKRL